MCEKLVSEAGTGARELACLSGPLHATLAVHQDGVEVDARLRHAAGGEGLDRKDFLKVFC